MYLNYMKNQKIFYANKESGMSACLFASALILEVVKLISL